MNADVLKLMNDYEFCDKLTKAENEAEAKELFKQHGVDITPEEFDSVKQLMSSLESELKKLNTEQLQAISGGVRKTKKSGVPSEDEKGDDKKGDDKKGTSIEDTLNLVGKAIGFMSIPFQSGLNFASRETEKKQNTAIKQTQITQDAITKRHAQTMQAVTISTAVVAGTIAGALYYGLGPIKRWWNGV